MMSNYTLAYRPASQTSVPANNADELDRLRHENAELRRRLAVIERQQERLFRDATRRAVG